MRGEVINCSSCIRDSCILKFCGVESLNLIDEHKVIEHYSRGQLIFREGDEVNGIYVVHTGKVKVYTTGFNNKTQIIRLAGDGNIIGHRGLGHKHYSISAMALEDTVVAYIETTTFNQILRHDISLTYHMMHFYRSELYASEKRMKRLAQMSVREKVADALLQVMSAFGKRISEGILLEVQFSGKEFGEISSLRGEQVIRTLSEFREDRIIRYNDHKKIVILKEDILRSMVASYDARIEQ